MRTQQFPHPTVGALIFNPRGEMLLVQTHKWYGKYVVPGGHIELGERIAEALVRETKEETGLDVYDLELLCVQEFLYDETFWKSMHFIFFDFTCKTDSTEVTLNEEAESWRWETPERALDLPLDDYTRKAIEEVLYRQGKRDAPGCRYAARPAADSR